MKLKNKILISCIALCALSMQNSFAVTTYYVPDADKPDFEVSVFLPEDKPELPYELSDSAIKATIDGLNYWSGVLKSTGKPITVDVMSIDAYNAYATSQNVVTYDEKGNEVIMPMAEAEFKGINWTQYVDSRGNRHDKEEYQDGFAQIYIGTMDFNDYDGVKTPLVRHGDTDILATITHEVSHALGLGSYALYSSSTYLGTFKDINTFERYLKIYDKSKGKEITAEKGMTIVASSKSVMPEGEDVFNIKDYRPYFTGEETIKVLGGNEDYDKALDAIKNNEVVINGTVQKGLAHYQYPASTSKSSSAVWGLPVNGVESSKGELSHIELRNSLLSHQTYSNWVVPMEAELALFEDIGYQINRKDYFGKSYYLNNLEETNNAGYTGSKDFGIGLHIYGDNNKINQASNISSTGAAAIGARVEGVKNDLVINQNTKVDMSSENNLGIAVTYGSGHNITIENGAKVSATGKNGIGASFDFGLNNLGVNFGHRGSYIFNHLKTNYAIAMNEPELMGALVENFNISETQDGSASLVGKYAAIYIADNAYVKNINVMDNAKIQGDIISEWNSKTSGPLKAMVQSDDFLITNLNFGVTKEGAADSKFETEFSNSILAPDAFALNVKGGNLTLENKNQEAVQKVSVYDLNINNGATLNNKSDDTKYTVSNSFTNDGTFLISENSVANVKAKNFTNNNSVVVNGNLELNSTDVAGNGVIDVNQNGVLSVNSKDAPQNTTNISNTVQMETKSTLSTLNEQIQKLKLSELDLAKNVKFSFDIGDTLQIDKLSAESENEMNISQISADADTLNDLSIGKEFQLFDGANPIVLNGSANVYSKGVKYSIKQADDLKFISVNKYTGDYTFEDAAADSTTGNYVVTEKDVMQNENAIPVNGSRFEISGADLNFDGHKGLEIETGNDTTVVKTSLINTDGAAITAKGDDNVSVVELNALTKPLLVNSKNSDNVVLLFGDSSAKLDAATNSIKVVGNIKGYNDNKNKISSLGNAVYVGGLNNVEVTQNASNFAIGGQVTNSHLNLTSGNTQIPDDSYLSGGTNFLTLDGGGLYLNNNEANQIKLSGLSLKNDSKLSIDLDVSKQVSDTFVFDSAADVEALAGNIQIENVNLVNPSSALTAESYKIPFIADKFKNTNLLDSVEVSENIKQQITTPVFKYDLGYEILEDDTEPDPAPARIARAAMEGGFFTLNRGSSSDWRSYNPAILASPVAAQVGGYLTQLNTYEQAFYNMDMLMLMTRAERTALKNKNKYASTEGAMTFSPNQIPEEQKGIWFRPYTTFEKVGLRKGPRVENIAYGSLFGGDSDLIELKSGWDMVWTPYLGYTGSHQNYAGNSIYQNGGLLGLSSVFYKNNFFTGLTANVGASGGRANTMYGYDDFGMLSTGIASKSGFNLELADSKFIVQPSLLMSYSFVNTFDYTNAAGVKIQALPLHALQITPEMKFIGNLSNGWQPYMSVAMVWNLIDGTRFKANDVSLPSMSLKPYVQYGVGIQKRWGERFTGFGQTMIRNGGRNGVSLQVGMRWSVGKQ